MKSDFYFDDRVLAFAFALLVWSAQWGLIDAALREPPHIWGQHETRANISR